MRLTVLAWFEVQQTAFDQDVTVLTVKNVLSDYRLATDYMAKRQRATYGYHRAKRGIPVIAATLRKTEYLKVPKITPGAFTNRSHICLRYLIVDFISKQYF